MTYVLAYLILGVVIAIYLFKLESRRQEINIQIHEDIIVFAIVVVLWPLALLDFIQAVISSRRRSSR